jgi:hypothetical protein
MGKREKLVLGVLKAVPVVLPVCAVALFWCSSVASADTYVCGTQTPVRPACPAFTDPRGDLASRPGTIAVIRYGPYNLPPNSSIHNSPINFSARTPCTNCYITDMMGDLVYDQDPRGASDSTYATGAAANLNHDMMLHHFVLINPDRTDAVCATGLQGQLGERVFAAGNERTHMHLPASFGYPNTASNWRLLPHIVNRSASATQQVSIQVTYRYRPNTDTAVIPSYPLWFDIDGCADSEYTAPVGYSDSHDPRQNAPFGTLGWVSTVSGRMIGMAGHLHDVDILSSTPCTPHCAAEGGGIAVSAELMGAPPSYYGPVPPNNPPPADLTGTTLCRSEGNYGTPFAGNVWQGHLDTMTQCGVWTDLPAGHQAEAYPSTGQYPSTGVPFSAGQVIKLHSEYQNGTPEPQTDVMGILMGWYVPQSPGYARPKGATPTRVSLVPSYQACSSPNRTHGAPLSHPSCGPPAQSSSFLTVGSPDTNGQAANSTAVAQFTVVVGNSSTPADEADVKVSATVTDVRNQAGLSDYTGQLKLSSTIRITDRDNGPTETGTAQEAPLSYTLPCVATSSTSIGSTCSMNTTADALAAGTVKESMRTIWQMGKVDVFDGGADGLASTNPNTLFLTQGYFVP